MDTNKIDKIDTNLIVPSIQENLIEIERDKWGNILNEQTFKTLNNNMKVMKEILLEIANENNVTNLDSIKLRLNNLETDRDSIESIVDNNTNGLINVGLSERRLNLKGTQLEFNNSKIDLQDIAFKSKENTFKEVVDTDKYFTVNKEKVLDTDTLSVSVGNVDKQINLVSKENKVFVNGIEFKVTERIDDLTQEIVNLKVEVEKFIDEEELKSEITMIESKLKDLKVEVEKFIDEEELKSEITMIESKLKDLKDYIDSLQLNVDLTPYVPFSKGFRNQNNADWFVRTDNHTTVTGYFIDMYNGDNNQFMGTFHTNGIGVHYKVPNRNGGNWNRILDEHDFNNLNTTVNQIVGSYVRDLRLSGYISVTHMNQGSIERYGYVVTGLFNADAGTFSTGDLVQMRALQMNRGGNWYNVPFA